MKRGDYDYQHATTNTQFLALIIILAMMFGAGIALGLAMLGFIL